MKFTSLFAFILLTITISACSEEEDFTYNEIQVDMKVDPQESTKGNDMEKDGPEEC